jgi:sarcosine oxidase
LPDVVVVGAGVFGAWTALTLLERGAKVTLLDAYGPGHARATSCDEVRQIRMSYGDREVYTRSAMHALQLWKTREQEFGRKLVFPGGRLVMRRRVEQGAGGSEGDFRSAIAAVRGAAARGDDEALPAGGLRGRRRGVSRHQRGPAEGARGHHRHHRDLRAEGREHPAGARDARRHRRTHIAVTRPSTGGGTLSAGAFVFACGPWLRHVFPDLLGKVITTSRIEIAYIGSPAGDHSYRQGVLPNLSEEDTFPGAPGEVSYTQSDIDAGLKIARGGERLPMDLDRDERIVSARQIRRIHEYVRVRFPRLKEPIVASRVCQSDASPDSHFVLDRHPGLDNVWIAGGGSGHGFKHGPVVGEYMADRVTGRPTPPELERVFSLAGRA